jgi:uncharacterized membrane protein YoaK (UPF0700 family)
MKTWPRQQVLTTIAIALTFASGAADVASFTRLGNVFTSVMTGNIVLWGLAAARGSLTLADHTAVAIAGYIAGVAGGTWVAHGVTEPHTSDADSRVLPPHVIWVLVAELTLLAGFTVGWEVSGAAPAGWAQFALLATLAAAMGMQSAAVRDMGLSDVATTYLTGTLTGLVSSLAKPGHETSHGIRRFGVLIGLLTGACLSGMFIATAADGAPALPLAALVVTLVVAARKPDRTLCRYPVPVDAVVVQPLPVRREQILGRAELQPGTAADVDDGFVARLQHDLGVVGRPVQ